MHIWSINLSTCTMYTIFFPIIHHCVKESVSVFLKEHLLACVSCTLLQFSLMSWEIFEVAAEPTSEVLFEPSIWPLCTDGSCMLYSCFSENKILPNILSIFYKHWKIDNCKTKFSNINDKGHKIIKGTVPQKSTWAFNVHFSEKTTMLPFIWEWNSC